MSARSYYLGAYPTLGAGASGTWDDGCASTPYQMDDGSTVMLDCEGRVIVQAPPSAWDIFFHDPAGEISRATGAVARGVGQTAGEVTGSAAAGASAGLASGLINGLMQNLGGLGGAAVLIGAIAVAAVILKR